MRTLRLCTLALGALLALAACSPDKGAMSQVPDDCRAEQLSRKPFYTANPDSSAPVYTVLSDEYRLAFAGWGSSDPTFTLDFPEQADCRRVIMRYTMGSDGNGPASYDNTTIIWVRSKGDGKWYEITRAFTPFGDEFDASWQKHFYIDVTEFESLLRGATEFRYHYAGFDATESRAHTFQLCFYGYEGDKESEIVGMTELYSSPASANVGSCGWAYGIASHDIEADERLGCRTVAVPEGVSTMLLRLTITGHGHDMGMFPDIADYEPMNAAEFVENSYSLVIDGVKQSAEGRIFYSNANNYYQGGTYYYDRANWAPGNPANTHYWTIERNTTKAGKMTIDIDLPRFVSEFDAPNANDGVAHYIVSATLFFLSR